MRCGNRSENGAQIAPKIRVRILKQAGRVRRLRAMRDQLPTALTVTARAMGMVALAVLLILVLLPAVLAAQAAGMR